MLPNNHAVVIGGSMAGLLAPGIVADILETHPPLRDPALGLTQERPDEVNRLLLAFLAGL